MLCTLSKKGKVIRGLLGLAIIAAGIHFESWWGALGAVLIVGALAGFCPMDFLCKSGDEGKKCGGDHKCG